MFYLTINLTETAFHPRVKVHSERTQNMKRFVFIILLISNILVYSDPIKVGILDYWPPFSTRADSNNHYFGFAIDLMDAICMRLKRECVYMATPINDQLNRLNQGSIDVSFAPNPITPNLPDNYLFSLPFIASNGQLIVLQDSNINTIADIEHKKIGVFKLTLFDSLLTAKVNPNNTIIGFEKFNSLVNAFLSGNVDVIMLNYSFAQYFINTTEARLKLVGNKISLGNGYGILALKRNSALIDDINHALLDMEEDGSYMGIYNQYFSN